eukprot:1066449-Rhodomonas_salina.4
MPFQTILSSTVFPVEAPLQRQLRTTREWIQHNLDPPAQERADVVPSQSQHTDIITALSLHDRLDCPYVSENSIILASLSLDPELLEAWKQMGINFEQPEEGELQQSFDNRAAHWDVQKEMDQQLWTAALSHSMDTSKLTEMMEDPEWLKIKAEHVRQHNNWI